MTRHRSKCLDSLISLFTKEEMEALEACSVGARV